MMVKRIDVGQVDGALHYTLGWNRQYLFWGSAAEKGDYVIRFRPHYLQRGLPERLRLLFKRKRLLMEAGSLQRLNTLAAYLSSVETTNPALLSAYLNVLVEEASTLYREQNGIVAIPSDERLLLRLLDLIEANFRRELRTLFYAGRLGVADRKLNALCKQGTGFMVMELIEQRRLEEAEARLGMGKMPVKTIAAELNFCNGNHFGYWFQQRRGIRPLEYRTRLLKNK